VCGRTVKNVLEAGSSMTSAGLNVCLCGCACMAAHELESYIHQGMDVCAENLSRYRRMVFLLWLLLMWFRCVLEPH
jgi:hypothetical protein